MPTGTYIRETPYTPNTLIRKLFEYKEGQKAIFAKALRREPHVRSPYMHQIETIQLNQSDIGILGVVLATDLSKKQGNVLGIRYGLYDGTGHTLKETAELFSKLMGRGQSLAWQNIRDIETRAIINLNLSEPFLKIALILEKYGIKVLTGAERASLSERNHAKADDIYFKFFTE
jgi:hypothetical protein